MNINYTTLLRVRNAIGNQSLSSHYSKQMQDENTVKSSLGRDTVSLGSDETRYAIYSASAVSTINMASKSSTVNQDTVGSSSVESPSIYYMTDKEISETLRKVKQEAKSADYTGMNDVEIYRAITERYTTAFGADFMDEWQLNIPREASSYDFVISSYEDELCSKFESQSGSYGNVFRVARQANYGNMSSEEIKKTIMEKYPPVGQLTYRDTLLMASELRWAGEDEGCLYNLVTETVDMLRYTHFNSTATKAIYSSEEQIAFAQQLMDKKLDPSAMAFTYNARKFAGRSMPPATAVMMTSLFGLARGTNGTFSVDFDPAEYFLQSWNEQANTVDDIQTDWWNGDGNKKALD